MVSESWTHVVPRFRANTLSKEFRVAMGFSAGNGEILDEIDDP